MSPDTPDTPDTPELQPCCNRCWRFTVSLDQPNEPVLIPEVDRRARRCAWCGETTLSGIEVVQCADDVPYPFPQPVIEVTLAEEG